MLEITKDMLFVETVEKLINDLQDSNADMMRYSAEANVKGKQYKIRLSVEEIAAEPEHCTEGGEDNDD